MAEAAVHLIKMAVNKFLAALALVVGILSAGCAEPGTLDVGYNGAEDGYTAALIAADAWNSACQQNLISVHRGEAEIRVLPQAGPINESGRGGETRFRRANVTGKEAYEIAVMTGANEMVLLAHEFGHALGIDEHTDGGIMDGNVDRKALLDPATNNTTLRAGMITPEQCAQVAR